MTFDENNIARDTAGKFEAKTGTEPAVRLLPSDLSGPGWEDYGRSISAAYRYQASDHEPGGYDTVQSDGPMVQMLRRGELHNISGPARVTFSVRDGEVVQEDEYFVYGRQVQVDGEDAQLALSREVRAYMAENLGMSR